MPLQHLAPESMVLHPSCDPQELLSPEAPREGVPVAATIAVQKYDGLSAKVLLLVYVVRLFNSMGWVNHGEDLNRARLKGGFRGVLVTLDIGGGSWTGVCKQISSKPFAVHLK